MGGEKSVSMQTVRIRPASRAPAYMQPVAHTSMALEYCWQDSMTSGARYHLGARRWEGRGQHDLGCQGKQRLDVAPPIARRTALPGGSPVPRFRPPPASTAASPRDDVLRQLGRLLRFNASGEAKVADLRMGRGAGAM